MLYGKIQNENKRRGSLFESNGRKAENAFTKREWRERLKLEG